MKEQLDEWIWRQMPLCGYLQSALMDFVTFVQGCIVISIQKDWEETSSTLDLYSATLQPVDLGLAVSVARGTALPYGCNEVYKCHQRKRQVVCP